MARNRYENSEWEKRHERNVLRYERLIDEIFRSAASEAASIVGVAGRVDSEKPFSFGDYPATKRRVDRLLAEVQSGVEAVVVNGIEAEWQLANEKNDELCDRVFGEGAGSLSEAQRRQYYTTNGRALEQFEARKISGLSLSERVWRYTEQFRDEIEMGIDIGIREGMSADRLSRQLRQYLRYPDKLFRRVRDERGNLVLSRRARAFHPGQGVYRSSYKNARRLAATETNIAYRSADYERWKRLDFVVGIHVILSNNHTTRDSKGKKVALYDICNELSGKDEKDERGKYPKDFKFTGWHPQCRCHAISILKTQEEMDADNRRIMDGVEPTVSEESVNAVREVPVAFRKWVEENAERIERAKSLPYFISDNRGVVDGILQGQNGTLSQQSGGTASRNSAQTPQQQQQKQSTNPVSTKMPSELDLRSAYLRGEDYTFDKRFFDLLDEKKPIQLTIENNSGKGSRSAWDGSYVIIDNNSRNDRSPWHRKSVIYHEYGHCIDAQRGLYQSQGLSVMRSAHVKFLREKIDEEVNFAVRNRNGNVVYVPQRVSSRVESIDKRLQSLGTRIEVMGDDVFAKRGITKDDVLEQILSTRDAIRSLIPNYGRGHSASYFMRGGYKQKEYLAHAFENAFIGNPVFKKYLPTIYDDMVRYIMALK